MTKFRPCIDLHDGKVKQIVGGTLEAQGQDLQTNFVSEQSAGHFAAMYAEHELKGGHVIKLGPGNEQAAREALAAYPGGLQIGGGIHAENAAEWLEAGASAVIVTSFLFRNGVFQADRLDALVSAVGRERLVIDLSCRVVDQGWVVAMDRWQTLTDMQVDHASLDYLAGYCSEFLVHAADVEGKCGGIDEALVALLGQWQRLPITYAGGVHDMQDLHTVDALSAGTIDVTVGSALDIFGGSKMTFLSCVAFNQRRK